MEGLESSYRMPDLMQALRDYQSEHALACCGAVGEAGSR